MNAKDIILGLVKDGEQRVVADWLKRVERNDAVLTNLLKNASNGSVENLAQFTNNMGRQRAGAFISGTSLLGLDPDDTGTDFTGVFVLSDPITLNGVTYTKGVIGGMNAGVPQAYLVGDDGTIIFGGGVGKLDANGIAISPPSSLDYAHAYKFGSAGEYGSLVLWIDQGIFGHWAEFMRLEIPGLSNFASELDIFSTAVTAGKNSVIDIKATGGSGGTAELLLDANTGTISRNGNPIAAPLFFNGNGGTCAAGVTKYGSPFTNGIQITTPANNYISPYAGTLSKLYVETLTAQGARDFVVTVCINGVAKALTITINNAAAGVFTDLTHSVTVAAGDLISVTFVEAAGGTSAQVGSVSMMLS